eukprot:GEMP01029227.1.p2 GENE.GEMP01029227.1~~GEMP01029227.1.p2  ORF type:complete len:212 (-),score=40.45 GEMP01029227.1:1485-2120(-)
MVAGRQMHWSLPLRHAVASSASIPLRAALQSRRLWSSYNAPLQRSSWSSHDTSLQRRRWFSKSAIPGADLWQATYDDILRREAAGYPDVVQRIHAIATKVRAERELEGVDQSRLAVDTNAVLSHRRVLYVMVARESAVLCSTRQTASEDMLEITTRQWAFGSKKSTVGRWLREVGPENVYCYLLESLHSVRFHQTEPIRRKWWERTLRDGR